MLKKVGAAARGVFGARVGPLDPQLGAAQFDRMDVTATPLSPAQIDPGHEVEGVVPYHDCVGPVHTALIAGHHSGDGGGGIRTDGQSVRGCPILRRRQNIQPQKHLSLIITQSWKAAVHQIASGMPAQRGNRSVRQPTEVDRHCGGDRTRTVSTRRARAGDEQKARQERLQRCHKSRSHQEENPSLMASRSRCP